MNAQRHYNDEMLFSDMEDVSVAGERERLYLKGLFLEWKAAIGVLKPAMQRLIRPPVFRVSAAHRTLGSWAAETRELAISQRLFAEHGWETVREVLYHETAHQIADELLGARGESAHGATFREACRLIGANPRASGGFQPLDQRLKSGSSENGNGALRRIRKLLALAGSPHREEAETAMAKAHELMKRHNASLIEAGSAQDYESTFVGVPALRHPREEVLLGNLLQDFYFVRPVWVPAFVPEKQRMGRVIEISGTVKNLAIAGYVFDYVRQYTETQWRCYSRDRGLSHHRRSDFAVGLLEGFREKLSRGSGVGSDDGTERGLRVLKDPCLDKYVIERYPCLRTEHRRGRQTDARVLEAGMRAGESMVIRKGVHEHGGAGGLLA